MRKKAKRPHETKTKDSASPHSSPHSAPDQSGVTRFQDDESQPHQRSHPIFRNPLGFDNAPIQNPSERTPDNYFEDFFDASPIGSAILDTENRIVRANPAFYETTGYTKEEIIGQHPNVLFHPDEPQQQTAPTDLANVPNRPLLSSEKKCIRKDKTVLWLRISATPRLDTSGKPTSYVALFQDITEQKRASEKSALLRTLHLKFIEAKKASDLIQVSVDLLKAHLQVDSVNYGEFSSEKDTVQISHQALGSPISLVGTHHASHFISEDKIKTFSSGKALAIDDIAHADYSAKQIENFKQIGVAAFISEPLLKENDRLGMLSAASRLPRKWREDEKLLLKDISSRLIPALKRIQAENAMRQSDKYARLLLENAPASIAVLDAKMRYLAVSKQWTMENRAGKDLTGKSHYETIPNQPAHWRAAHLRSLNGETVKADSDRFVDESGNTRYANWETRPWYTPNGKIGGIVIMTQEVTDRIESEKREQEANLRFRSTFENATVGIAHKSTDGAWLRVNQKMCEITGYTHEELLKMTYADITHPLDKDADWELATKVLSGEIDTYSMDKRYIRKDGSTVWVALTVSLQRDEHGNPLYFISFARDINSQKRAEKALLDREEELLRAKEAAEKANKAKDEFLSVMSHELRTPLNPIIGFAQLLSKRNEDPFVQEAADLTLNSARRMLELVNSVLDFARLDRREADLQLETFSIDELTKDLENLAGLAKNSAKVQINLSPNGLEAVSKSSKFFGPFEAIEHTLSNLTSNALKFGDQINVSIEIGIEKRKPNEQTFLHLKVSDYGPGVPANYLPNLFSPFSQADNTYARKHEGLGLGLAICERLVAQMKGRIEYRPNVPHGSVFSFSIPIKSQPSSEQNPAPPAPSQKNKPSQAKILIVEDCPENADYFLYALRSFDVEATHVDSGEKAIELCKRNKFDVAMIDISMPGLNGLETLERLKDIPHFYSRTTCIAVTAHASDSMRQICLKQGFHAYLSKPVTLPALRQTIQNLLLQSNT